MYTSSFRNQCNVYAETSGWAIAIFLLLPPLALSLPSPSHTLEAGSGVSLTEGFLKVYTLP